MLRLFATALLFAWFAILQNSTARASVVESVTMSFESGASFTGTVTFTDDFSSYTDVSGTLFGYTASSAGYVGAGSDPISWVLFPSTNYASGSPNIFGNFLADGTAGDVSTVNHAILLTYDYTNAPTLTFAAASDGFLGVGNSVDYSDPMVSGSIQPLAVAAVPEMSTWILLLVGFVGLALLPSVRKATSTAPIRSVASLN
jgi:hypothetical protein